MEDIDKLKHATGRPRYRLSNADVFVSPGGFHYIGYLDPVEELSPEIDASALSAGEVAYIEKQLQSNPERFAHQVDTVKRFADPENKRALDIGCGGGLFLARLAAEGANVTGIELSDSRAQYAATKHGLDIVKRPIESGYWHDKAATFDCVTIWDVIEHVNYPGQTLRSAAYVLRSGGLLFIDTPCRDSFYHRFGALTYRLTGGRFPTFLNAMYSAHRFGHKQIFSTAEMRQLVGGCGLEVLELQKFHELSFPYRFYLKKLFKSEALVTLALPLVTLLLAIFPLRNKMLAVARKP